MSKTREGISTSKGFAPKIYVPVEISLTLKNNGADGVKTTISYYHGGEKKTLTFTQNDNDSLGYLFVADLGSYIYFSTDAHSFGYVTDELPLVEKSNKTNNEPYDEKATFIVIGGGSVYMETNAQD